MGRKSAAREPSSHTVDTDDRVKSRAKGYIARWHITSVFNFWESLDAVFMGVILYCSLCLCPFEKVEESFSTQAVHDFVFHGLPSAAFDHHPFPGVVPRTCLGALLISCIAVPVLRFWRWLHYLLLGPVGASLTLTRRKWEMLLVSRGVLGFFTFAGYNCIRRNLRLYVSRAASVLFTLGLAFTFHIPFYSSRFLPNTFALGLSAFALADFIALSYGVLTRREHQRVSARCIALLFLASAVFRCDVIVLAIPVSLMVLMTRALWMAKNRRGSSLYEIASGRSQAHGAYGSVKRSLGHVKNVTSGFFVCAYSALFCRPEVPIAVLVWVLSLIIDSYFWLNSSYSMRVRRALTTRYTFLSHLPWWVQPMWPELYVLFFNTVEGQSSAWGVSPWHAYITDAIPRALGPLALYVLALPTRVQSHALLWTTPVVALSFLGHKEMRFIFPSLLALLVFAAIGAARLLHYQLRPSKKLKHHGLFLCKRVVSSRILLGAAFLITGGLSAVRHLASAYNYPGGWALHTFYGSGDLFFDTNTSWYRWKTQLAEDGKPSLVVTPNSGVAHLDIAYPFRRYMSYTWNEFLKGFIDLVRLEVDAHNQDLNVLYPHISQQQLTTHPSDGPVCQLFCDTLASHTGASRFVQDVAFRNGLKCVTHRNVLKKPSKEYHFFLTAQLPARNNGTHGWVSLSSAFSQAFESAAPSAEKTAQHAYAELRPILFYVPSFQRVALQWVSLKERGGRFKNWFLRSLRVPRLRVVLTPGIVMYGPVSAVTDTNPDFGHLE